MTEVRPYYNLTNPQTGKSFKDENLEIPHNIPLGTLVEVKWDSWFGDGACWKVHARLWVVRHNRDCDGTPLYTLSRWPVSFSAAYRADMEHGGFSEDDLTPIDVTPEISQGQGALGWEKG